MRRDQHARLDKLATRRRRPVEQMTDSELHEIIRSGIEQGGGTEAVAAKHRAEGDEHRAMFVELYMAGDPGWEKHIVALGTKETN